MLDLTSLKKAIEALKNALSVALSEAQMSKMSKEAKDTIRAGVIQSFEFTYEVCWKFMKRWLENNLGSAYVDGVNRRELFRLGVEHHLISNIDNWMEYHDKRDKIVHSYDQEIAKKIFESAKIFLKDAKELLGNLEKHNN